MKKHKERRHSKSKKDSPKDEKGDAGAMSLLRRLGNQNQTILKSRHSLIDPDEAIEQRQSQVNATNTADDSLDIGSSDTPDMSGSEVKPDWYEDLTDDHTSAFKELFDMLDASKTGLLNANSLYEGLKRVDSEITKEEVENVLKKLDKDGNGEIDFDEFLFHMTQGDLLGGESDDDNDKKKGRKFSKRQRLFYTAITEFSKKTTLGDIERSYLARMRQAPHVLSHYTAGVRLIGLTDRQLTRQFKKMQKTAKNINSPYAKPLPFVSQSGSVKPTSIRRQVGRKAISKYKLKEDMKHSPQQCKPTLIVTPASMSTKVLAHTESDARPRIVIDTIPSDNATHRGVQATIHESLKMWDKRHIIVSKLPGSHRINNLRAKNRTNFIKLDSTKEEAEPVDPRKPEPTVDEQGNQSSSRRTSGKPKIDKGKVPLPVLKIKNLKHRPTIDDLPNIREKATQAINDYYQNMRKATVKDAFTNWDKLYADTIRPKKLLENFRTVYRAYSPHKEENAFVVCPWMPGPYRHFRTILTNRDEGSPDFRMERVYRTGLTPDSTNKRPFSH
ncbi:uncharacterized protein LOC110464451 [Mizuhopecten yessoensis]|uniref:uncharacterized protein LOC110464451 n=1 Tax=Mizuhopecten yessoensis TaxID=6573 RepID=UPI000B45E13D|nr:uncharacterized protein LOC110464451 [Mizuhopecten yessoensis]